MKEEYLDDATPCTECDLYPVERVEKAHPFYLCGIPIDGGYGTCLICRECGKKTSAYENVQDAYKDWNENINRRANDENHDR